MINKINANQIIRIVGYNKLRCLNYVFLSSRRYWYGKSKEGYYKTGIRHHSEPLTQSQVEQNKKLYCEDKKVFYYPHIEIILSNNQVVKKFFSTEKEMIDYVNSDVFSGIELITI